MKAKALTVHWHLENQPIYSAHFQPSGPAGSNAITRLATAGGDNNVRIWRLEYQDADNPTSVTSLTYLATLAKHTQAVNVVRFDPKGAVLASAGDDGTIFLWVQSDINNNTQSSGASPAQQHQSTQAFGSDADEEKDKETWKLRHVCRSSISEVYDLAWSPDSQYIIAGSMDNIARVYNAQTGQCIRELAEHSHYVQGVAWDPFNEYIATQSSDRSVHIYSLKTKDGQFSLGNHYKIAKADLPVRKPKTATESRGLSPSPHSNGNSNNSSSTSLGTLPVSLTPASMNEPYPRVSASPDYSAPGTPSSTSSAMHPPPPSVKPSHSRKSSFGANTTTISCPESPRSTPIPISSNNSNITNSTNNLAFIPLPAVRQLGSPSLGMRSSYLYHNETFTSFFRRLTFSPDGSLLLTPSGVFKYSQSASGDESKNDETTNTVYIYTRAGLNRPPVAHLPGLRKPSLAISCSPVYYTLRRQNMPTTYASLQSSGSGSTTEASVGAVFPDLDDCNKKEEVSAPVFALKYRMIYAVATQDSIIVYDTEQKQPLCIVSNLHYSTFTDLTWSPDGNNLLMTSTDGFCSVIIFEKGELGERYTEPIPRPPATILQSPRKRTDSAGSGNSSEGFGLGMGQLGLGLGLGLPSTPLQRPSSSPLLGATSMTSEPLVPLMSAMPPIVSHGSPHHNQQSSPPHTPVSVTASLAVTPGKQRQLLLSAAPTVNKRPERTPESGPVKKRRIAPTLVSENSKGKE